MFSKLLFSINLFKSYSKTFDFLNLKYNLDKISCAKRIKHVFLDYIYITNSLVDTNNRILS
jgi:hypothetical protein